MVLHHLRHLGLGEFPTRSCQQQRTGQERNTQRLVVVGAYDKL